MRKSRAGSEYMRARDICEKMGICRNTLDQLARKADARHPVTPKCVLYNYERIKAYLENTNAT